MNKKLIVIGDQQTVQFFTLVGAVGFEVSPTNKAQFSEALASIREQAKSIGGILVASDIADMLVERIDRMQGVEIPIIRLPDPSGESQIGYLETLMEKAIGMKLETGSLLQKKA